MTIRCAVLFLVLALVGPCLRAQQTGVAIGASPGSAIRNFPQPVVVSPPKPTCESPADLDVGPNTSPALPDMLFSREGLVCVRLGDGRTEELSKGVPLGGGPVSHDTRYIAYWFAEKHELHIFSIAEHSDRVVDTLPGANLQDMVWSRRGHTLAYLPWKANPPGIRTIDLDTGRHGIFAGSFTGLVASPDPEYVVMFGADGLERRRVADGHREVILRTIYIFHASYSHSGTFLGILASMPGKFLASLPDVAPTGAANPGSDDDALDCRGAFLHLILQTPGTKQLVDVRFPEGFDTVLDFEFSPDERAIAVTFGVNDCDYPGSSARVYKVSLADLSLTPISPANGICVKAHWSPDGKAIVYQEGAAGSLVAVDVQTGKVNQLTNNTQSWFDSWLGWR